MIAPVLDNMRETEVWLEQEVYLSFNDQIWYLASVVVKVADIDWTVVRPAGLTNKAVTEKEFRVEEDFHV